VRANSVLFLILALFFWLADAIYITWSVIAPVHIVTPAHPVVNWWENIEWVGAVAIALSGILAAFISFYVGRVHSGQGGELPEDRVDAEIDDGDAEQGFFSPWSWWPIMLAVSAGLVFTGLAIGVWISFIGAGVLVVSLIGWQYEYYRGYFAH
jgi:hypothetical protein